MASEIVNALTVDVEDYFHVSAFESHISRKTWDTLPCRIERNSDRILQLFDDHRIRGTFFTLGWVAERYPSLVRRIADAGHELASHGYSHVRACQQTREEFSMDITRAKKLLEDIAGYEVKGYRAASYSINQKNLWALEILQEAGYHYSSSVYPICHDLYGMPEAPRFPFRYQGGGLLEIPITTVEVMRRKFPSGGGGFFRLFPYAMSRWAIRRVNEHDGQPCIFYFHPWEIDPDQPRQKGVSFKTRLRHYMNLHRMEDRLCRLLKDFRWDRMDRVFLEKGADTWP